MKRMDLFCASHASTAICTTLDHHSVVRHGTKPPAHPHAPDRIRRYPHGDNLPRTIKTQVPIPCTSYQLAITPRPKSHRDDGNEQGRRQSSADASDAISLSPPGSPRYFLSDKPFVEPVSEPSRCTALVPVQPVRHSISSEGSPSLKKAASCSARTRDQVVVLRVSLHCKGCESKVRKLLSRMEGVRSFSIDLEKKKVTVKGEVTPLSVLESVSRVMKNTQLLSSSPSLS